MSSSCWKARRLPTFCSHCWKEYVSLEVEGSSHVQCCIFHKDTAPSNLCFCERIAHTNQLSWLNKFFISKRALVNGSAWHTKESQTKYRISEPYWITALLWLHHTESADRRRESSLQPRLSALWSYLKERSVVLVCTLGKGKCLRE